MCAVLQVGFCGGGGGAGGSKARVQVREYGQHCGVVGVGVRRVTGAAQRAVAGVRRQDGIEGERRCDLQGVSSSSSSSRGPN